MPFCVSVGFGSMGFAPRAVEVCLGEIMPKIKTVVEFEFDVGELEDYGDAKNIKEAAEFHKKLMEEDDGYAYDVMVGAAEDKFKVLSVEGIE